MTSIFGDEEPRLRNAALATLLLSGVLLICAKGVNMLEIGGASQPYIARALLIVAALNLVGSGILWLVRATRTRRQK